MGRPRLIIIIRHAQSEGNKNRDIHQTIPDHRVKLTKEGWQQAYEAGRRLRAMLRPEDTLHFFTSPYRRTRETTEGILATLTSDEPETSPFKRDKIKVYEEPRLREQDFGNFQPCSAEMERMWQERADYGHFFYRIPNGESAADAYDRISGFNESLWRQFGEDDFASVCVLVTHGLMSRVFLMKWYHFSVEYFEDLRNINHCEFLIMRRNDETGKYILENKLRTWSELKRERAALLAKENGETSKEGGNSKDASTLARAGTIETRRRWGGCPNGCNHDKNFRIRQTLADLVKSDSVISDHAVGLTASESGCSLSAGGGHMSALNGTDTSGSIYGVGNASLNGSSSTQTLVSRRPAAKRFQSAGRDEADEPQLDCCTATSGPQIDVTKARDEAVSSPDGTPSYISVDDRLRSRLKSPNMPPPRPLDPGQLHVGRDFGGTYSGHNSGASDDPGEYDEEYSSEDEDQVGGGGGNLSLPLRSRDSSGAVGMGANGDGNGNGEFQLRHLRDQREQSRMGRGMRANRLGDHHSSDGEHDADGEHELGGADVDVDGDGDVDDHSQSGSKLARPLMAANTNGAAGDEALNEAEREDKSIMGSVY